MPSREAKCYLKQKLERKAREINEGLCSDCNEAGHTSNHSYKCQFYDKSKKRKAGAKDDFETKAAKAKGRKRKLENKQQRAEEEVICKHCGQAGHSTKASFACSQHITTKAELLQASYYNKYEMYARKLPIAHVLRQQHGAFRDRVVELCNFIREVTSRARLFMNYYILKNRNLTAQEYVFEQNFWYSVCKLVLGQEVTNKEYVNHTVALTFDDIATAEPSILYPFKSHKMKCYSDAMSAACVNIAVMYTNNLVENFSKRIRQYLYWRLKDIFAKTKKGDVYDLIDSYCLPKILEEDTLKWSKDVDASKKPETDIICQALIDQMPASPTTENLTAAPSTFLPPLAFMLQYLEATAQAAGPDDTKPKLFSLTPTVSFRWSHVTLNEKALGCLTKQKTTNSSYANSLEMFHNVFDFTKFGYETLQDLTNAPANGKDMFNCVVHTDGFAVTFLFVRAKKESSDMPVLTLEDFEPREIERYFVPVTVDPGRNQIFTAAVGYDSVHHQVRTCSKEERANIAGYTRRAKIVDNKKHITGIKDIESEMPTSKTVHSDGQYMVYLSYVLRHLQALHDFYGFHSAEFIFNDYQGGQRANEELANMLIDGGKKYNVRKRKKTNKNKRRRRKRPKGRKTERSKVRANKAEKARAWKELKKAQEESKKDSQKDSKKISKKGPKKEPSTISRYKLENTNRWTAESFSEDRTKIPLIIFGDGMRDKDNVRFKGHPSGVTGKLYRTLFKRQRCFLAVVVDINEFRTSKVCNNCNGMDMEEVQIADGSSVYGTKACKTCGIIWQRDVNAAKNMLDISNSIWNNSDRPAVFTRNRRSEHGAAGSPEPTAE